MKDQEIYTEIAQTLFDEIGGIDEVINFFARISSGGSAVDKSVWKGDYMDAITGVILSNETSLSLHRLVADLNQYYRDESMGGWNLMLYKLAPHGKSFSIDFEFNDDLENGKITLYEYRKRFRRPMKQ
ncbi:hypothetical protein [Teredinibacter turnerae]|uniref:hypothetical protein n=1 Tax=Teredinibacter turnerae TaxID=2426 RepID=UPI00036ABC7F|nr:hypothetical protein [Teredinibacter turnerae]